MNNTANLIMDFALSLTRSLRQT